MYNCLFALSHFFENMSQTLNNCHPYWLRVCLFGEILGRMKNLGEKSGEGNFNGYLVGRGSGKKNVVGFRCFLPGPTKTFSLQNGEKTWRRSSLTWAAQKALVHSSLLTFFVSSLLLIYAHSCCFGFFCFISLFFFFFFLLFLSLSSIVLFSLFFFFLCY